MDELSFSLKTLCTRSGEGSFGTRALRQRGLLAMAQDLKAMGYRLPDAWSIRGKHINALVSRWKTAGLSDQTVRNRLTWLRWWGYQVGKPGLLPKTNDTFGLAERGRFSGNKAKRLEGPALDRVTDRRVQLALKLEAAFGMRREEALKFRPQLADKGDCLVMKASWCKGGRSREIPLTHPKQRALLDEVKALVGDGSLIGQGRNYYQALKSYENQLVKAGISNAHGYRHAYAQWRYKQLTGWSCPAAGGPTVDRMTPAEADRDRDARMTVSHELGHGRLDVTDTYLGRRFAPRNREAA
ncbi:phage integrase N-terminal domain-containing protein [Roseibium aggregatum]|uniref:Integrase n=1 Tax=Roseibium aggregatum TaxID=187304 RepID=A0A926P488_9HYPH|nr:phage integrase N-terminal domain-containing protein [Roseibium aggregatum]MBD1549528.1 integrase [Roseibium aggregatum]